MSENSALEETIRKAVTATLKSLTPEQIRELTMEPYESGPDSEELEWLDEPENVERPEPEDVPDISSLPARPEYPRDVHASVVLTTEKPTLQQRAAIVDFLVGQGVGTVMFTEKELLTLEQEPTEEYIASLYGELAQVEDEESNDE